MMKCGGNIPKAAIDILIKYCVPHINYADTKKIPIYIFEGLYKSMLTLNSPLIVSGININHISSWVE